MSQVNFNLGITMPPSTDEATKPTGSDMSQADRARLFDGILNNTDSDTDQAKFTSNKANDTAQEQPGPASRVIGKL